MTIGENIKRIRKERGLTQKELGELLDMTQSAIGQFENDKTSPKADTIEKIASALGVSPSELMKGNSMWEEFDKQYPNLGKEAADFEEFINFLGKTGYGYHREVIKWHWEDENEHDPSKRIQIIDEAEFTLMKDGDTATFTQAEFEALQAGAKEAIEGRFYKKVLEQQKKK